MHGDLLPGRIKRDEHDVNKIIDILQTFTNPSGEEKDLLVITSGIKTVSEIEEDLLLSITRGLH